MSKKIITIPALCFILFSLMVPIPATLAQTKENEADNIAQTKESPSGDNTQAERNWDEMLHYALIGRADLAEQFGQALLQSQPDPVFLHQLAESEKYANSYRNLYIMQSDPKLKDVATEVLKLIEEGRFRQRTDYERIVTEVKRLSGTTRGRMLAIERLKDSGEWSVPVMIQALRQPQRSEEMAVIKWALPQLGKEAVNPLVTALQKCPEINVKIIILDTLSQIGYPTALPFIQQIIETEQSDSQLKSAASAAFSAIDAQQAQIGVPAAVLFERLAENYYDKSPSLAVPADQSTANIWFWKEPEGLYAKQVEREAFDELMTMRCCETALGLNPNLGNSISLWLSAFFRYESEGFSQPDYFGAGHPDASTYALTAGPEYLHRVLAKALVNRNRAVALAAIKTMERNSGQQSLLYELEGREPLIEALTFPDREVRFNAALAIAEVLPRKEFNHREIVVPILAEALRQKGQRCAIVIDGNQQRRNEMTAILQGAGQFENVIGNEYFSVAAEEARKLPSIDLLVIGYDIQHPDINEAMNIIKQDYRLAFCPTIIISDAANMAEARKLKAKNSFVESLAVSSTAQEILQNAQDILSRNHAIMFDQALADQYALKAVQSLRQLALTDNPVLSIKPAEAAILQALQDQRKEIQLTAVETLAHLDSQAAQRAIADLALTEATDMPTRLTALNNLSVSAKSYGNLLSSEQVKTLYDNLVNSPQIDSQLRNTASQAYGSLNLPSAVISQMIIEQSKVLTP